MTGRRAMTTVRKLPTTSPSAAARAYSHTGGRAFSPSEYDSISTDLYTGDVAMSRATASCASLLRVGLAAAFVLAVSACQYYAPNTPVARDSTEGITLAEAERLRSRDASRSLAASQIRIPTGMTEVSDGLCRDWLDPCWETLGIEAAGP